MSLLRVAYSSSEKESLFDSCKKVRIVFILGIIVNVLAHKAKCFVPHIFVICKDLVFLLVKVIQLFIQITRTA